MLSIYIYKVFVVIYLGILIFIPHSPHFPHSFILVPRSTSNTTEKNQENVCIHCRSYHRLKTEHHTVCYTFQGQSIWNAISNSVSNEALFQKKLTAAFPILKNHQCSNIWPSSTFTQTWQLCTSIISSRVFFSILVVTFYCLPFMRVSVMIFESHEKKVIFIIISRHII